MAEAEVDSDTLAQRRHRTHQSRWRHEVLGLPAGRPSLQVRERYPTLGNYLPESYDGKTATEAGWNLMSDEARTYTRERLEVLARAGGLAEPDRLWRNMLSSQPLAFSIAGHLRAYPGAAVTMFAELTGLPVVALDRLGEPGDDYVLDGIDAEWSPPREHHTGDRSGFDLAAILRLDDGARVLISIEVKYVDSFSRKRLDAARYQKHLTAVGLSAADTAVIVDAGGSQLLRSVLLTSSVQRRGLRGETTIARSITAVLARADDTSASNAVRVIAKRVPESEVVGWSHAELLDAAARQPFLAEWADQMRRRYLPGR